MKVIKIKLKDKEIEHEVSIDAIKDGEKNGVDIISEISSALLEELQADLSCEIINSNKDTFEKYLEIKSIFNLVREQGFNISIENR